MNWRRIGTGTLIAAVVLALANWTFGTWNGAWEVLALNSFVRGFLVTWLYALIRPRLGPGPKTAVIAGSVGHFFAFPESFLLIPLGSFGLIGVWAGFVAATFLAGWQYLEKAPD